MLTMLLLQVARAAPLDPAAFAPLDAVLDAGGVVVFDGDGPTVRIGGVDTYTGVLSGGIAVFTFGSVVLDTETFVVGSVPVAVLSQGDLVLSAPVSAFARDAVPGAGGHAGATDPDGADGEGPGGGRANPRPGAGGGGFGGDGADAQDGGNGGHDYGNLAVLLEGGSGGAKSTETDGGIFDDFENGDGGGGGGAVEIGAGGRIDLTVDGSVTVDGAAGEDDDNHGGGGGSGGAIVLHAVNGGLCEGLLSARGGAGGDDGGFQFSEGGGGGGGRITVLDLETMCPVAVDGGTSPNGVPADDGATTFVEWVDPDADGDGWTVGEADCDDTDVSVHPEAEEIPGNGVDEDCDGQDPPVGTDTETGTDPVDDTDTGTDPVDTDTDPSPDPVPTDDDPLDPSDEELVASGTCGCAAPMGGWPGLAVVGLALGLVRRRRQR